MKFVVTVVVPLLVIFTMFVVGLKLTREAFVHLKERPRASLLGLLGQWLLPPLVGVLLARLLALPPVLAVGIVLAAAAPVGVMSNYYALVARANVALAVTLTAVSSVAAGVSVPLAASLGYTLALGEHAAFDLPVVQVLKQTIIGLLLPVLAGMAVRRYATEWVLEHEHTLQRLALLAVALLVAFIVTDQIELIRAQLGLLLLTCVLFTLLMLGAGILIAWLASRDAADRSAMLFGFPARNMGVAMLVGVAAFGRLDIAAFAAVFFLVQVAVLLPLAGLMARSAQRRAAG